MEGPHDAPTRDMSGLLIDGRYRVRGPLAPEGRRHSSIWTAEGPQGPVILKVPASQLEARRAVVALADLDHPNVVRLLDVVGRGGRDLLVLEHLDGPTLAHRLRGGPLPVSTVVRILVGLLRALETLHARAVVHGDVKPSNLVLTEQPVLFDLGAARVPGLPSPEALSGTSTVMSPEQILGHPLDARADLYAVGVLAYRALTGIYPFLGDNRDATLIAHLQTRPAPLRELVEVPPGLHDLVMHLLELDRAARPASASVALTLLSTAVPAAGRGG